MDTGNGGRHGGHGCIWRSGACPRAGVSLNGVRIGAKDVLAVEKFYQSAFGMQEVQRIQTPEFIEVMLNFGATLMPRKPTRPATW